MIIIIHSNFTGQNPVLDTVFPVILIVALCVVSALAFFNVLDAYYYFKKTRAEAKRDDAEKEPGAAAPCGETADLREQLDQLALQQSKEHANLERLQERITSLEIQLRALRVTK